MLESGQPQHEMVLKQIYTSGAEDWYCPTCGRRFIIQWPPNYKKVILEAGDEYASHTGAKRGSMIGDPHSSEEDAYLDPWREWMDTVDFGDRWSQTGPAQT